MTYPRFLYVMAAIAGGSQLGWSIGSFRRVLCDNFLKGYSLTNWFDDPCMAVLFVPQCSTTMVLMTSSQYQKAVFLPIPCCSIFCKSPSDRWRLGCSRVASFICYFEFFVVALWLLYWVLELTGLLDDAVLCAVESCHFFFGVDFVLRGGILAATVGCWS